MRVSFVSLVAGTVYFRHRSKIWLPGHSPTFTPRGGLNVDRSRAWEDFYDELVRSLGSGHPIRSGDVEGAPIIAQR